MRLTDIILDLMQHEDTRLTTLANRAGVEFGVLRERIHQSDHSTHMAHALLGLLGYKLVLIPKDTEEQPDWYRIE